MDLVREYCIRKALFGGVKVIEYCYFTVESCLTKSEMIVERFKPRKLSFKEVCSLLAKNTETVKKPVREEVLTP